LPVYLFRYRATEEFYDLRSDPDCLNNLIDESEYKDDLRKMQNELREWMKQTRDPLLTAFENRYPPTLFTYTFSGCVYRYLSGSIVFGVF
jgi:hypothetical protein